MEDFSPRIEGSKSSLYGSNNFCESFLDKTTLAKVALVVLAFLSIAAAITLGGWGETLLPHAFTLKHQIIAGCLLGVFGLALGLGVLTWQTCGSSTSEPLPKTQKNFSTEWMASIASDKIIRRIFFDNEGIETELIAYGDEAESFFDDLGEDYFKTSRTTVDLWMLFKGASNLECLVRLSRTEDGNTRIECHGLDKVSDGQYKINPNKFFLNPLVLDASLKTIKILGKDDTNLFSLQREVETLSSPPIVPTEDLDNQPEAPFTQWEPTLCEGGDPDKFFRREVTASNGTAVTLVYYGDDPIVSGNKIAEQIQKVDGWQHKISTSAKPDGPTFFCTYPKEGTTDTVFIGYGLLENENAISIDGTKMSAVVKRFPIDQREISVTNAEQQPLITLSRVVPQDVK